tara:strand:+ start:524 stop:772 length:249 start_codon:yes stop_codon:yes gene_type:complete
MHSVEDILKRNARVELEKAWEVSRTRRGAIAFLTYLTAATFLKLIGNEAPFLNALVPFGGYLFSTLSLPLLKDWWMNEYGRK